MRIVLIYLFLVFISPVTYAANPPAAAIASAHPLATEAGVEILNAGGNAFDAAVAVSAALAVVEPYSSGIGGGGFWLLHRASDKFEIMIDGREKAPLAAHRDMYLDDAGHVVPGLSMNGPLAAGIPGEPAALAHIADKYGRLPLGKTLAPAIRLAEEGFAVDAYYQRLAGFRLSVMQQDAETAGIFLDKGQLPEVGFVIRQPDLANTLRAMAQKGHEGFYQGDVADRLIKGVKAAGGIWAQQDLDAYRIVEREPVRGTYNNIAITTVAPPSSGGIVLVEMLNILSGFDLSAMHETDQTHLIVEAMRRAYRDRAEYLGDTDFVDVPLAMLGSADYAAGLRQSIRLDRATASSELSPVKPSIDGPHTTHFSIIDKEGNRVAATLSINYPFGAAFTVPGTGVLLNDEMDDFSAKPGAPNAYGLVGAEANAIEPGKRMLSSMTPTFLETEDRIAILGTPGGSRIITMVLLGALEFAHGRSVNDWVSRPRFHHQYLPDAIQLEPGALSQEVQDELQLRGHALNQQDSAWGNMQAVLWDKRQNKVTAASDPRGVGDSWVGQR